MSLRRPTITALGPITLVLVFGLLIVGTRSQATPPRDAVPPNMNDDLSHSYLGGADNSFEMWASDEPGFILHSWFAAAFGRNCPEYDTGGDWSGDGGWLARYWQADPSAGIGYYANPITGSEVASVMCHQGEFHIDFDYGTPPVQMWDKITYQPNTWGNRLDVWNPSDPYDPANWTEWSYDDNEPGPTDILYYDQDVLTGTPVFWVDNLFEGGQNTTTDNYGWMYFWPHSGFDHVGNVVPWKNAMFVVDDAYECTQVESNGESCMKKGFTYLGNGFYEVWSYFAVIDGPDSAWGWDPDDLDGYGRRINDFNMVWTPRSADNVRMYIVRSEEYGKECACDIDLRWDYIPPDDPEYDIPGYNCDTDPNDFDGSSDYPLGFLRAMNLCSPYVTDPSDTTTVGIRNLTATYYGSVQYNQDRNGYAHGYTWNSSASVISDYGTADRGDGLHHVHSVAGPRMTILNTGRNGDTSDVEFGGVWWTGDIQDYVDYALPNEELDYCPSSHQCCSHDYSIFDRTTIDFDLDIPEGVEGFSYDLLFVSAEFPEYVSSVFNDGYETVVETNTAEDWPDDPNYPGYLCDQVGSPWSTTAGKMEGNVAYDDSGTPLRINNQFMSWWDCNDFNGNGIIGHDGSNAPVATTRTINSVYCDCANSYYPTGGIQVFDYSHDWPSEGACWGGYQNSGGTGWLRNAVPVESGETIHVRFSIFDRADGIFDTFVLLDNWQWLAHAPPSPTLFEPPNDVYLDPTTDIPCLPGDDCDNDGYCNTGTCIDPGDQPNDCLDTNPNVNPGETEIGCNGLDDDCDPSTIDGTDDDGDGYSLCPGPLQDCNDNDNTVYPGATEIPCDGIDQDCSGSDLTNLDADGDGAIAQSCGGNDCDDGDPNNYPGNTENCVDNQDNDCDGDLVAFDIDELDAECMCDMDGDGYDAIGGGCGGNDCNDTPGVGASINPGQSEIAADPYDNDCDGWGAVQAWDFESSPGPYYGHVGYYGDGWWDWVGWSECHGGGGRCWYIREDYDNRERYRDLWFFFDNLDGSDTNNEWRVHWWQRYRMHDFNDGGVCYIDWDGDWTARYTEPTTPPYDGTINDNDNPLYGFDAYTDDYNTWHEAFLYYPDDSPTNEQSLFQYAGDVWILYRIGFEDYRSSSDNRWLIDDLSLEARDADQDSYIGPADCDESDPNVYMGQGC